MSRGPRVGSVTAARSASGYLPEGRSPDRGPSLTAPLHIRPPEDHDGPELARLYRHAFGGLDSDRSLGRLARNTVVAATEGHVVGLACWSVLSGPRHDSDLAWLLSALEPTTRALLDPPGAPAEEVEVAVRVEAPPGLVPVVERGDRLFTALAVHPALRRRGVATALTLWRLELARERGARRVFVHCVEGAGTRELYARLGFLPLLTMRHRYRDGRGMTLMMGEP